MPDDKGRRPPDDLTEFWDALRGQFRITSERRLGDAHPGDLVIATSMDRILVRIHPDGTLTYGPEYTPDEAAVTFWTAMAQRRLQMEERLLHFALMERLLTSVGRADLAYERAQTRARAPESTPHDREMEEMSRRSLEGRVHEVIEFARGLALRINAPAQPPTPSSTSN